jgi:hypothetical protein
LNPLLAAIATPGGGRRVQANVPSSFNGRLSDLGLVDGDAPVIPAGQNWLNDLTTSPALGILTLNGLLTVDTTKNTELKVTGIRVFSGGGYLGNTASSAFTHTLIPNGAPPAGRILGPSFDASNVSRNTPNDGIGQARGILIEDGGRFELYGKAPTLHQTVLADHVNDGATSIKVVGAALWKAGEKIILAPTSFVTSLASTYTREYTVDVDTVPDVGNGWTVVNIREGSGIVGFHWGKLQYATDAGMSLTPGTFTKRASGSVSTTLDERAEVMHMTRNMVIAGPNDTAFTGSERFGFHIMKMGLTGSLILDGVELIRCGQGGALGRYPIHWHMNSYNVGSGAYLGSLPAGQAVVQKCSIRLSHNRGVTMHGCRGAVARNNSFFDIKGHCLFLEDGSEMGNTLDGNWVFKVRDPGIGFRIKFHDESSSCMWISNMGNTIKNNRGGDSPVGRWVSRADDRPGFPGGCFGPSSQVAVHPFYIGPTEWSDNTFHSTYDHAGRTDDSVVDEQGNVSSLKVMATDTQAAGGNPIAELFLRDTFWKGNGGDMVFYNSASSGNYGNRIWAPNYDGWVVADCIGADLSGATQDGTAQNILFVAKSLNNEALQDSTSTQRMGIASYHGLLPAKRNTFIGYVTETTGPRAIGISPHYNIPTGGGAHETYDNYLNGVELSSGANTENQYINCNPMWRAPGPNLIRHTSLYSDLAASGTIPSQVADTNLSMAMLDYEGKLGGVGRPQSFLLYNHPFVTTGLGDLVDMEPAAISRQKVTNTLFYGANAVSVGDLNDYFLGAVNYIRADPTTLADIGGTQVTYDNLPGRPFLQGHHVAFPKGSAIRIWTPTSGPTSADIVCTFENLRRLTSVGWASDDTALFGAPWPNGTPVAEVFGSIGYLNRGDRYSGGQVSAGQTKVFTKFTSKATFLAASGAAWWQDTTNNMVWVRLQYPGTLGGYRSLTTDSYALSASWSLVVHA